MPLYNSGSTSSNWSFIRQAFSVVVRLLTRPSRKGYSSLAYQSEEIEVRPDGSETRRTTAFTITRNFDRAASNQVNRQIPGESRSDGSLGGVQKGGDLPGKVA